MDFAQSAKMIKLSNTGSDEFYSFVLSHIDSFNVVQMDMLMNCVDLEGVDEHRDFFETVYEKFVDKIDKAQFRAQLRFDVLAQMLGKFKGENHE